MPPEVPGNVPGVDDDQIADVAGLFPTLPNIRAEPADRFAQAVRSLVEMRARNEWPNEEEADVAVFVMVDHPRRVGERHGAQPFADPIAKEDPLLGRIFFANRDASSGRSMTIPIDANAILDWLENHELTSCPMVSVYRKSKTMVTRSSGTRGLARSDPIRDREPVATLSELLEALEYFHMHRLLTPTCCPDGVWEPGHAHQYIPGRRPERSIQKNLEFALNFWFHGVLKAEHEDRTNIGRIDVRLLKKSAKGPLTYWAIIELKVIRSFTNAQTASNASKVAVSTNVRAIVEGIKQALAYQANRHAEEGVLEVYDLRMDKGKDLTQCAAVANTLKRLQPVYAINVRPLFGTASDARDAGFTGA